MEISIIRSVEDAREARGLAVIVDVFRAFTTEAFFFAQGAGLVIPTLTLDEAHELKALDGSYVLAGERGGLKPEGFDLGNSPTEVLEADLTGKTVIHTTSNGTKGLMNTVNADEVLVGSFVMARSIAEYARRSGCEHISLVSTSPDVERDNEDILFALYVRDLLLGNPVDEDAIKRQLATTAAYGFLQREAGVPATDFDLCLDFDRFDFVIRRTIRDGRVCLVREMVK